MLDQLISLDVPFLPKERRLRVENLRAIVNDPTVALPEKYRRIMEAFQIEMEYGRNIEAYNGQLKNSDQVRTVEFLRIGRIALIYRTFDGEEAGYWDVAARKWELLPADYNSAIAKGFRIAKKEAPPDLIKIPVSAPEPAS